MPAPVFVSLERQPGLGSGFEIVHFSLRCFSMVGRQPGSGAQKISIGRGCGSLGIVVHEIGMEFSFASAL